MPTSAKKDNSTFELKVDDRLRVLRRLDAEPVVCETHGGFGRLFTRVYSHVRAGIVFEMDPRKAAQLGLQRPTWRVYEAEAEAALAGGVGKDLAINVLDLDPYGSPWGFLEAFLKSRPIAAPLWIVVNDGLRQKLRLGGAWHVGCLADVVARRGNDLHDVYLDVVEEMVAELAGKRGCKLERFAGYYCGSGKQMTHWTARITPAIAEAPPAPEPAKASKAKRKKRP